MKILVFDNPEFNEGLNLTVRRGTRWANEVGTTILIKDLYDNVIGEATIMAVSVKRFVDLTDDDLELEHDPNDRTVLGLAQTMQQIYRRFNPDSPDELVTLIFFEML